MSIPMWLAGSVEAIAPAIGTLLFKGLLLGSLGFLLAWFFKHAKSSTRYRYWSLYFAALVLLPLLAWTGAAIKIQMPEPVAEVLPLPSENTPITSSPTSAERPTFEEVIPQTTEDTEFSGANDSTAAAPISWPAFLVFIWFGGFVLATGWLLIGHTTLFREMRRGSTDGLENWHKAMSELVIVKKPARMLITQVKAPMLWGFFRPVLLLPEGARQRNESQIRMTLIHELVHLQRGDLWANAISNVATAMHWYNPLVWLAQKRFAFEQEQSCDDAVLAAGTNASDYAELLLQLAWQSKAPALPAPAAVSIGFGVKERLYQVLTPLAERRTGAAWPAAAGAIIALLIFFPLAAFNPVNDRKDDSGKTNQANHLPSWLQADLNVDKKQPKNPKKPIQTSSLAVKDSKPKEMPNPVLRHGDAVMLGNPDDDVAIELDSRNKDLVFLDLDYSAISDRVEWRLESFEEEMEDWFEAMEQNLEKKGKDNLCEEVDSIVEVLEERLDTLGDIVDEDIELLEEQVEAAHERGEAFDQTKLEKMVSKIEKRLAKELSTIRQQFETEKRRFKKY